MKFFIRLLLLLMLAVSLPQVAGAYEASLAWFTDASIDSSIKVGAPTSGAPGTAPGTILNGVLLDVNEVGMDAVVLTQAHGMISFWIKPNWNGNDGVAHRLIRIGSPTSNGLLIEKSDKGMLRFVMAGGGKVTASRHDVSNWQSGKWHQVVCSWIDLNNKPLGLCLWVDKVCVDSTIWGGTAFMNPATMADKKVYIGSTTTNAVMDELMIRGNVTGTFGPGQLDMVYRDYFRTAPFTQIKIDPEPNIVKSDTRVVKNAKKQFGLKALMEGQWVRITDFAVRYGNWSDFDAKCFINWTSSNTGIASVDNISTSRTRGLVTGKITGTCNLTATFRGMSDVYSVQVISNTLPDLDVMYVERTPRYSKHDQKWPTEGETVQSIAHIANFGYTNLTSGATVTFELIPDTNHNFICDPDETATETQTATTSALTAGQQTTVTFNWTWTMIPTFVRVTVDPNGTVSEICEANNQRCELNVGRAYRWGYNTQWFADAYTNKTINLVGSFSDYDWCTAEVDRMSQVMREAVYDTTSPVGIQDSIRVDNFYPREYGAWEAEPFVTNDAYYDGGFPDMEPQNSTPMDIDAAIGHEIGHTTIGLPDLYGHPYPVYNCLLKDPVGNKYADTPLYPSVSYWGTAPYTTATYYYTDVLGVGYSPLMVYCHLWLHPSNAGFSNQFAQERRGLAQSDQEFTNFVPSGDNRLQVFDVNDAPLKGAAVYMYQLVMSYLPTSDTKYLPDRPKFIGNTDDNGYFTIPKFTHSTWDDWETDQVDGAIACVNPFARVNTNGWGASWTNGEYFIIKVVSGDKVEFSSLPLTELNQAYYRGNTINATYSIKTSLTSVTGGTLVVPPVIPDAIKVQNRKPVAVVPDVTVRPGAYFTLDGSSSYDPEGQPLNYRWLSPVSSREVTISNYAPMQEGTYLYDFYVNDGLRNSDLISAKLLVRTNSSIGGKVTDANGNPVPNAIVGVKKTHYATADADYYFVADANGNYGPTYITSGNYYVSAWKEGYTPSADVATTIVYDTPFVRNIQLGALADPNLAAGLTTVSASDAVEGAAKNATDGNFSTSWASAWGPASTVYYYVDLGGPAEITDVTIYRYLEINPWGGTCADYWIDAMTSGNPLNAADWNSNPAVTNVYSASQTFHGYPIQSNMAVDPIGLHLSNVKGLRLRFQAPHWPPQYRMYELQIHGKYPPISGRVLDQGGNPLPVALVGFKTSAKATADTDAYVLTDSQGRYSLTSKRYTTCYVAAWKDGYCPSTDKVVSAANGAIVPDITLDRAGVNLILKSSKIASSNSYSTNTPSKAVDATMATNWRTQSGISGAQYFYIDLGSPMNVTDLVTYRHLEKNGSGDSRDDYQIDVMTSPTANPLLSSSWNNSANGISTVHQAGNTIHGYEISPNMAVDPIRIECTGIRGIRLKFTNYHYPRYYDLKEIQVHQSATYRQVSSISELKNANTGDYVILNGTTLTALPGNGIPASTAYIEEPDRFSGIRLDTTAFPSHTAAVGNTVNVKGRIGFTTDLEKSLQVTEWDYTTGDPVLPLLMNVKTLGGAPFGTQDGAWLMFDSTLEQMPGLNNMGLLVKICGKVTQISTIGSYFYLDDGSGITDGTKTGVAWNVGIRIPVDGRAYTAGQFLTITGISSCFWYLPDSKVRAQVRPITIE